MTVRTSEIPVLSAAVIKSNQVGEERRYVENQAVCRQHSHHHKLFRMCRYGKLPPVLNCEITQFEFINL
jgi:hypothetical protein